ncbi:S-formylglutathione hydrolase [Pseudoalteromonas luteoviolacea B = ATCC 29581]|nr:S-formylglutathione hydrolase [Pseudoalteromonas luteoviolacea B = ATCC 29581]
MSLQNVSQHRVFDGWHKQYMHRSEVLNCTMRFAIFLPPQASEKLKVPVLYWLSGLTCTDENFMQKAGVFRVAAELGIAIVAMDTSPRGEAVADDSGYDLGQGAGFYVNATQAPWDAHYKMDDYVTKELPALIQTHFPITDTAAIAGHSMGGHGALTLGLKNTEQYVSISAFSPISNPTQCPWGEKAFTAYFGQDMEKWKQHDASILLQTSAASTPILVDQGEADNFLVEQLKPHTLELAAQRYSGRFELRMHPGYDHSYYFISSFIDDHLRFHAEYLF